MDNSTTMSPEVCYWDDYMCSNKGTLLPLINEKTWSRAGRATVYLLGLLWCFLGVAIIADVFMCAIEKITSKTQKIKVQNSRAEKGYDEIEIKVWNGTVANLTLMALGSSAPEILLSTFEILFNNFNAGDLGPSTIVGSAAFNFLVIIGVCIYSIPSPDTRRINSIKVFAVTAFFCVFAYVWLIIVLKGYSPDYIDLGEAILTLLFFPILVVIAYLVDKDFCRKKKPGSPEDGKAEDIPIGFERGEDQDHVVWAQKSSEVDRLLQDLNEGVMTDDKMRSFIKHLSELHPNLTEEDIVTLASAKLAEEASHDRLWYRINATRHIGGNPKLTPTFSERLHSVYESLKAQEEEGHKAGGVESFHGSTVDFSLGGTKAVVEFTAAQSAVLEQDKRVRVAIRRYGKMNSQVIVRVETIDGTAESQKDYIPFKETLVFEKEEDMKHFDIEIIDDNEWEPDEVFFVKLSLDPHQPSTQTTILGKRAIQEVTIINDDDPGVFEFSKPSLLFKESTGKALIPIERHDGGDGRVGVKYRTEDMTAHSGKDYQGGEGTLYFEHGEMTKTLEIPIYDDKEKEKDECFRIEILELDCPGAKIGRIKKTIITIVNDDDFNGMVSRLVDMTNMNMDALKVESTTWSQQFRNAMNVNGGETETASHMDYIMHFLTFGWKIIFALVPPPSIWGGWLAFFIALLMIGILTIIVGDLASIFGCLTGLKDTVTAITFVALGTSLPDLFASKQAAKQEKYADNCIGNVTGSNSVNVFLGLGLPWVIASAYWATKGKSFYVPAGPLSFSVVIYTVMACIGIGLLLLRRYLEPFGKAELGGKKPMQIFSSVVFVLMWFLYVLLSAFQAYEYIPGF